ncbi:hypothetical protein [Gottfriedia solisilvae]|uniref:hypothetical protein n=1 Tax=Gottfriedia solisilvae TaxID=1516104 RepID=UPI003D2EF213
MLDVLGLIPGVGEIPDGINASWYYLEGDKKNAVLSASRMVPVAGWISTGGKYIVKYGDEVVEVDKDLLKLGKADSSANTGTVWDKIKSTAANISGTKIPATFQVKLAKNIEYKNPETGTNILWTNTNATKHMGEYIKRFGDESWSIEMRSQALLKSYSAAIDNAMSTLAKETSGRKFGVFGGWELGINTETGVVYHALMK